MNQITKASPVALIAGVSKTDDKHECTPSEQMPFQTLEKEIDALRAEILQLTQQNDELKQTIDSVYASPTEKRTLLTQIERKYNISRRRACRLLTFARSTCWYRSATGQSFLNVHHTDVSSLSNAALVQRLKKLARQAENGFLPLNENLQIQFEYGLNKIGLESAAHLSQTNLKLAMEVFAAWCRQARK